MIYLPDANDEKFDNDKNDEIIKMIMIKMFNLNILLLIAVLFYAAVFRILFKSIIIGVGSNRKWTGSGRTLPAR